MRRNILPIFLILACLVSACGPAQPGKNPQVITHPDGPLYVGDQVSFEVLASASADQRESSVDVSFDGHELGTANLSPFGLGQRDEAALWWVWDTRDLKAGRYTLTFTSHPDNLTWNQIITLHPASAVPAPEPGAHWTSTTTACCTLYYITGTAAARDIATLGQEADQESSRVATQLGARLKSPLTLVLMPRVIGQGGFTYGDVYTSYLDDNYIGNDMPILFHHEFVHYYDSQIGGTFLPPMFEEGLAVYLTGGHFKPEPLVPRAAALLDLGWYIPLKAVADDFYNQQHDIAYLESAALITYMVDTYGWPAFNEFYRSIPQPDGQKISDAIDTALHEHFNTSFADLEAAYLEFLRAQKFTQAERTDLKLTVEFFDTARRYQLTLDPSAYYLTAWLPDGNAMRQRGIVADLLRRPRGWKNRLMEALLIHAQKALFSGNYTETQRTLDWTNRVLGALAP